MGKDKPIGKHRKTGNLSANSANPMDIFLAAVESTAVAGIVSWVFYDSLFAMVLVIPIFILDVRRRRSSRIRKNKEVFDREFKEMLLAISDALQSGYSIENALKDSAESLKLLYGEKSVIRESLNELNAKISMRMPAEQAFMEFATKHPTEETLGFAQVFSFARRLGGDYIKNMRRTIAKMEEKLELKQDIAASIASKQMEFKIMCLMPVGILLYVRFTSGDFLDAMYGNTTGIVIMTVCIVIYVLTIFLGNKIVDIKV